MNIKTTGLIALLLVLAFVVPSPAQDNASRRGPGRWMDQPHVAGTIAAISTDQIDITTPDGKSITLKITPDTQFRKNRAPAKLDDFKVGDRIMALGDQPKQGPFVAKLVAGGGPGGGSGGMMGGVPGGVSREDLGKKFIMGEVRKIDETKLTILRPDQVEQVIEVDENTSFRDNKGESVTLADIKVGDHVGGRGELKNGVFVPQVLRVGVPEQLGPGRRPQSEQKSSPDQKPHPDVKQ